MKPLYYLAVTAITAIAAAKKSELPPYNDPADQLIRMAPMTKSSRSVVVNLSPELHLAFDTQQLRTHTVWRGGDLNLFGPCYHGAKRPFICQPNGERLWGNPPVSMWSKTSEVKTARNELEPQYKGFSTRRGRVTFLYQLNQTTDVQHSVYASNGATVRSLRLSSAKGGLTFLAHAEVGMPVDLNLPRAVAIQRDEGVLVALLKGKGLITATKSILQFEEEQFTVEGSTKGNKTLKYNGELTQIYITLDGNPETQFDVVSFTAPDKATAKRMARNWQHAKVEFSDTKPVVLPANPKARRSFVFNPYYEVEALPLSALEEMNLFVTGMDWLTPTKLAVCTYTGEVWIIENATGPAEEIKFRRFARGMNEPMGLLVKDGMIHLGNKAEITRLKDTDNDGIADLFERISSDWDYTGSYNSFSYGPILDGQGNFVVANAGHAGHWGVRNMGWALRIGAKDGKARPFASGFREPNGIKTFGPDKDLFVTDNQGAWIGACKLNHVKDGRFYGHPTSIPAPKDLYGKPRKLDPPAVWFPYKWVRSASDIVEITDDRFGPFKGQMLVGDFQNAILTRVQLEKVNGEWQGAVWPFLKGFQSGVNRMVLGNDGQLYVGSGKVKAWAANAPAFHALERVKFKGRTPFSVKTVRVLADGFELTFTKPVDRMAAEALDGFDVWQYRYEYHKNYGSPEFDHEGRKDRFTVVDVKSVTVSADNLKVTLKIDGWRPGYITAVRALDIRDAKGGKLWNDTFYYTLNQIPKR
jgi:hypothetical protein